MEFARNMSFKNRGRNYPLYEPTPFDDFRTMVENVADRYPDRIAFSFRRSPKDAEPVRVTYADVRVRVRYLATGMIEAGCREAHCAMFGEASYDWMCTYLSLMGLGAVTVPADRELPPDDIVGILERAECSFVFYSPSVEEKLGALRDRLPEGLRFFCFGETEVPWAEPLDALAARGAALWEKGDRSYYDAPVDPDRLASIVFTSGTTGKGKGVMLSQRNIAADLVQAMYDFQVLEKTVFVLPPHHTYGSSVNFIGLFAQGSEIYISSGIRYLVNEMKEQKPTYLVLVPLFVETLHKKIWQIAEKNGKTDMLRRAVRLSNGMRKLGVDVRRRMFRDVLSAFGGELRMIICGGAALSQDIIDSFEAFGIVILNGYGITECSPLVSCNRNEYRKAGSVGCPIVGEEIRIADPDENGEGEICVRGPNVMLGYYKDPDATSAAVDEDGFFHTGDWGRLDEEGWLYITGRIKNIIILANGKNVYPEEIEAEIQRVPGVSEVVVYAGESKNEQREVIVAEIYPDADELARRGVTDVKAYFSEEIKKINARMAPYKAVGHIKLRSEEFVKNTTRKILRFRIDKNIEEEP